VIFGEIEARDVNRFLRQLAKEKHRFPNGEVKSPSRSTLKRKLAIYRKAGFDGLARTPRSDRGKPRAHTEKHITRAIELKRDQGKRSHVSINKVLESEFKKAIPRSTLYWHLKRAGATRIKLGISKKKIRCRWTRDHTHDLWVGDFEHGPYVLHEGNLVPTRLSVFIDCHSRFVVEARYYPSETLDVLIDSLLRAWATHGAPKQLYVDNAKVYHAKRLKAACYKLNIDPWHRRKRDPPPGGLVEKIIQTIQSQFESEVRAGEILTLDQLNRALAAWLDVSYHQTTHSETGQTPAERYRTGLTQIRHVDLNDVLEYFMEREQRTVHPDFSDVQLRSRFYRVANELRGDRVEVRYDPYGTGDTVLIYSPEEEYLGTGELHHREKRADNDPAPAPRAKPQFNYLEFLVREHDRKLRAEARGIDYRAALARKRWPFHAFAKALAQLLGRRGDLTSFTERELELLQQKYQDMPALNRAQLANIVEGVRDRTLPAVLFALGQSTKRKE
jgi:transposase InsO family protein